MSLNMLGAVSALPEAKPEAEALPVSPSMTKDDLRFPRQGFPSFRASPMEIDWPQNTRFAMLKHYPDLYDLERRPWGVNAPEDAAFDWAKISRETAGEYEDEMESRGVKMVGEDITTLMQRAGIVVGGGGGGGHGGGHGGGGGHHGGGHGGMHGGGFRGGWGYGGPWYDVPYYPYEIVDDYVDADAIANMVAARLAFAADGVDSVGDAAEMADTLDARIKIEKARIQAVQPVTLAVALKIVQDGLKAANKGLEIVKSDAYKKSTKGKIALTEEIVGKYYWQLKWHQDNLAKLVTGKDVAALNGTQYADAEDLKRAAGSAVTELLVADFGGKFFDQVQQELYADIDEGLVRYAKMLADGLIAPLKSPFQFFTGLPLWAWALIALGGVGMVGYIAFKLLGTSAASAVATRFLPAAL